MRAHLAKLVPTPQKSRQTSSLATWFKTYFPISSHLAELSPKNKVVLPVCLEHHSLSSKTKN